MKKALILANSASGLYDFRNELLLKLLSEGFEVHVSLPDADKTPELAQEGCKVYHTPLDRRGMNPIRDMGLMSAYNRLIKNIKPDVVLTYTIKPNIYGSLCCCVRRVPYIANITGLGSVFEKGGMVKKLVVFLYRMALKNAACVFFQNKKNQEIFKKYNIRGRKSRIVAGSGVNLERYAREEYPDIDKPVRFLYVGRIMKEKGMDELLYAAKEIKQEHHDVIFELAGYYEDDYKDIIEQYEKEGILKAIGYQKNMHQYYSKAWAVLMPSYHEGMSNVILEAGSTGRPVLASQIAGCAEGFDDGITGFGYPARDKEALLAAIRKFLNLSYEEKAQMGRNARFKMEREFDRRQVVDAYMEEIGRVVDI